MENIQLIAAQAEADENYDFASSCEEVKESIEQAIRKHLEAGEIEKLDQFCKDGDVDLREWIGVEMEEGGFLGNDCFNLFVLRQYDSRYSVDIACNLVEQFDVEQIMKERKEEAERQEAEDRAQQQGI